MPRNLLAMAVGIEQKAIVNQIIQKVSNLVAFGHHQQMSKFLFCIWFIDPANVWYLNIYVIKGATGTCAKSLNDLNTLCFPEVLCNWHLILSLFTSSFLLGILQSCYFIMMESWKNGMTSPGVIDQSILLPATKQNGILLYCTLSAILLLLLCLCMVEHWSSFHIQPGNFVVIISCYTGIFHLWYLCLDIDSLTR